VTAEIGTGTRVLLGNEALAELRQRADTEAILRDDDPYYGEEGEANAFERAVTPAVVHELVDEIERLRAALAGHLFDGESLGFREQVRAEMMRDLAQSRNHHRATGIRMAARLYNRGQSETVTRGQTCGFLTSLADSVEEAGGEDAPQAGALAG